MLLYSTFFRDIADEMLHANFNSNPKYALYSLSQCAAGKMLIL